MNLNYVKYAYHCKVEKANEALFNCNDKVSLKISSSPKIFYKAYKLT